MIKHLSINSNNLILKRKLLLTFLLISSSIGSYTYSEITAHPPDQNKPTNKNLEFIRSTIADFSIYYLSPVSYIKKETKKTVDIVATPSENIMGPGIQKQSTLAKFLKNNNQNIDYKYAQTLASLYIKEANYEGVNPDIAFTQMCHETGFLRFDGTVNKNQNNFCGLGVTGNGVKGLSFKDSKLGVRAHIQHLKAYASTHKLKNELIDDRFKYVKRGSVTHLSGLTGSWAMDTKYDLKIRNLLARLYKIEQ